MMRKIITLALLSTLLLACEQTPRNKNATLSTREAYQDYLRKHPYNHYKPSAEELQAIPKADRPDLAWRQNFLATMHPELKRPTPEVLLPTLKRLAQQRLTKGKTPGDQQSPWVERGPNNIAGRSRALAFDPGDASGKRVFAGGVSGGLWLNTNIYDGNTQWQAIDNFWANLSVSAIAFDPADPDIIYVGTGEGWGIGFSGQQGTGIFKSTDGGQTFNLLSASTGFLFVNDLVVRREGNQSVLYAGVDRSGFTIEGLQRSTDGGQSFTRVVNRPIADLEIGPDNRLWLGTINSPNIPNGGGRILYTRNGSNFETSYSSNFDRIKLATAPSDTNYLYAIVENSGQANRIIMSNNGGQSWITRNKPNDADPGIPSGDFTRGQAWYDLSLAVDPNDPTQLLAGGIDLFASRDSAGTWRQISHWFGGFGFPDVHADQHEIRYKPGSSDTVLFSHDGGVTLTTNAQSNRPNFNNRNNELNITQFYSGAMHPQAGANLIMGGTQDNGTLRMRFPGITGGQEATGGDGGFCFIDQNEPNIQLTSSIFNNWNRSLNGGFNFSAIQNVRNGRFINPADYDDNLNILYSAKDFRSINRIENLDASPAITNMEARGMRGTASHLRVSPYHPNKTVLFVGTGGGGVFKYDFANTDKPIEHNLTQTNLPNASISCIEIGATDQELLLTYSNFGVNSVWYSDDGGSTWQNKEGDLPDMPVRWALFNPNDRKEVILATDLGIWQTADISAASPTWQAVVNGMANVRTDMLQFRSSDNMVLAATHGRGMFMSDGFGASSQAPVADFMAHDSTICGEILGLYDRSTHVPDRYQWTISPGTYRYVRNTDSTSRNPQIEFTKGGVYTIQLTASNSFGSSTETKSMFIETGSKIEPTIQVGGTGSLFTTPAGLHYQWFRNGQALPGDTNDVLFLSQPGDYYVEVSDGPCSGISDTLPVGNISLEENLPATLEMSIYPNPATEHIYLQLNPQEHQHLEMTLYNLKGEMIFNKKVKEPKETRYFIPLQSLPRGMYVLEILSDAGLHQFKIMRDN